MVSYGTGSRGYTSVVVCAGPMDTFVVTCCRVDSGREDGDRRTSAQTGRRGGSGARRPRRRAWSGQESVWRDWNCDRANTRRPRGSASFALGEGGLRTGGWRAGRSEIRWGFLGRNARLGGKTPEAVARDS